MFLGPLSEYDRDSLLESAKYWGLQKGKVDFETTIREVLICFEEWKTTQVDSDGKVRSFRSVGLLGNPDGKLEPAQNCKPWDCAGISVRNEIDLAFKLWLDSFPPFELLLRENGLYRVFGLVGFWAAQAKDVDASSLIRLNGFLTKALVNFAQIASAIAMENIEAKQKQNEGLRRAQLTSAKVRKEQAEQRTIEIRQMAVDFFRSRPADGLEECSLYIQQKEANRKPKLSLASIRKKIKGSKTTALRSMNTRRPT